MVFTLSFGCSFTGMYTVAWPITCGRTVTGLGRGAVSFTTGFISGLMVSCLKEWKEGLPMMIFSGSLITESFFTGCFVSGFTVSCFTGTTCISPFKGMMHTSPIRAYLLGSSCGGLTVFGVLVVVLGLSTLLFCCTGVYWGPPITCWGVMVELPLVCVLFLVCVCSCGYVIFILPTT